MCEKAQKVSNEKTILAITTEAMVILLICVIFTFSILYEHFRRRRVYLAFITEQRNNQFCMAIILREIIQRVVIQI